METLVLDGKEYVKASVAAKAAGYTSDYVGQLCRSGAVDAHLVGRSWYVNQSQLGEHRVEKKRTSRVKAREQVRKAVEEKKKEMAEGGYTSVGIRKVKHFEKRSISYEPDASELMPQVKKLQVKVDEKPIKQRVEKKLKKVKPEKESGYVIENKGNKVKMSGTLDVVDVTDENFSGSGTIILSPRILKGKKREIKQSENKSISRAPEIDETIEEEVPERTDFLTKLAQLEEEVGVDSGSESESIQIEEENTSEYIATNREAEESADAAVLSSTREEKTVSQGSIWVYVVIGTVLSIIVAFSLLIQTTWLYSGGGSEVTPAAFVSGYEVQLGR